MPCSSCVNFNRDCCVYDRWVPSSSSARPKQETLNVNRIYSWGAEHNGTTVQPTSPCFTSKVLLTKVQPFNCCPTPSLLLQAPFIPQSYSPAQNSMDLTQTLSTSSSWSPFDSPLSLQSTPLSPAEAMMRTVSLPNFLDRSWTSQSPSLEASPSSQPVIPLDNNTNTWTQDSSPSSSQSSPLSPAEIPQSGLPSPSSFSTPTTEVQTFRQLLYQGEKETQDLLQNVDALLMHLGNS